MKVSEDVLFRNHVHTFRLLFTNHTYRVQQMTKFQVRIQSDRKMTFDVVFLQRNTTNVEFLMSQFRRQYLKRSKMFLAMATSFKWEFSPYGNPFWKGQHSLGCIHSGIFPYKPTALLCSHASEAPVHGTSWGLKLPRRLILFLFHVWCFRKFSGLMSDTVGSWDFHLATHIPQNTGLFSGWLIASDSGFQSGWKKWILNVRAQFLKTRFSVIKRWWLPFRPRSRERYIAHSSGPEGS